MNFITVNRRTHLDMQYSLKGSQIQWYIIIYSRMIYIDLIPVGTI